MHALVYAFFFLFTKLITCTIKGIGDLKNKLCNIYINFNSMGYILSGELSHREGVWSYG